MTKRCRACGQEKSVDLFTRNRKRPDMFDPECRACKRVKYQRHVGRTYKERDPETGRVARGMCVYAY